MDNVSIYTDGSKEDHWDTVKRVLKELDCAKLYLNIDKCNFLCKEVKYLGLIIKAVESNTVDPKKLKFFLIGSHQQQ